MNLFAEGFVINVAKQTYCFKNSLTILIVLEPFSHTNYDSLELWLAFCIDEMFYD